MELKLNSVSFRYDDEFVFKDFNLSIKNGLTFVIGNNNSGKSTLFNIIFSKLPYSGNIELDNNNFKLFKNSFFLNDNYINSLQGKIKDYLGVIDLSIIEFIDIEDYMDSKFDDIDYSIKIKVCFAKFLNKDYDVIFIDNIMCWLGKNDRIILFKKLKKIAKKKIIVVTTNNMEDLLFANRIILFDKGNVVIDDDRDNFFNNKKRLEENKVSLPFIVDLSYNLKLYNIIDNIYFDTRKLVDAIWK